MVAAWQRKGLVLSMSNLLVLHIYLTKATGKCIGWKINANHLNFFLESVGKQSTIPLFFLLLTQQVYKLPSSVWCQNYCWGGLPFNSLCFVGAILCFVFIVYGVELACSSVQQVSSVCISLVSVSSYKNYSIIKNSFLFSVPISEVYLWFS